MIFVLNEFSADGYRVNANGSYSEIDVISRLHRILQHCWTSLQKLSYTTHVPCYFRWWFASWHVPSLRAVQGTCCKPYVWARHFNETDLTECFVASLKSNTLSSLVGQKGASKMLVGQAERERFVHFSLSDWKIKQKQANKQRMSQF